MKNPSVKRLSPLLLVLVSCASTGPDAPVAVDEEVAVVELLQADRDFLEATLESGIDGWVSFHARDAARVDLFGPIARGPEQIRAVDAPLFANPALRLRWEPAAAGVFADGDHGFTKGPYELVLTSDGQEQVVARGAYVTLWRRGDDGWRVILDTGAPEPPVAP